MGVLTRLRNDLINTFVSIAKGHRVTWRNLWRERVTLQYPRERPQLPERYRGIPGVHPDLCMVCGACSKACPAQVITIEGRKIEGTRHRELIRFHIEAGRCMFCGLCEEACPTKPVKAIRMSNTFELGAANKASLVLDLPRLHEIWKSKPVDVPEEEYLATSPKKLAERDLAKKAAEAAAGAVDEDPAARKARLIEEARAKVAAKKAAAAQAAAEAEKEAPSE